MVVNKAKLAYNAWRAGWRARRRAATRWPPPGFDNLRLQDRVAQALGRLRHAQGALELETLEPRAVFEGEAAAGSACRSARTAP